MLQARKRALRTADEGPSAQHSCRQMTRNSTLASRSNVDVAAEDESRFIPPSTVPPTTVQQLDPELVQSIVSTVAAEVTRLSWRDR
jgi:hypothetical protein